MNGTAGSFPERLHDGPLQNLLAARLDLDELRENPSLREGLIVSMRSARHRR